MKSDESPVPQPLFAADVDDSKAGEDQSSDDDFPDFPIEGGGTIEGDGTIDGGVVHTGPPPPPYDSVERGYAVEIFGDESGGQTPKLPRQKGRQDE
jgi:hypothetical protein